MLKLNNGRLARNLVQVKTIHTLERPCHLLLAATSIPLPPESSGLGIENSEDRLVASEIKSIVKIE